MKKNNEILSKVKDYINNFKLELGKINKESIVSFIKVRKYLITSISIIIIILLMVSGKVFITSEDKLLNDLEISMKQGNSSKIYGDILVADKKVSRSELDPLIKYYNSDTTKINKVLSELKTSGVGEVFTIKSNKKGIWKDYYLEVNTVDIKVNCNFSNAKIFVDSNELNEDNRSSGIVPGLYKIKAILKTNYGDVEKEIEVSLIQNEEVSINLEAVDLNITSNFNDAKVLINDKDINKKVSEIGDYGPIPTNESIDIGIQREFPWGIIKSEKIKVNDSPNINIDINMVNEELTTQIELSINKFYESVFNALNKRDYRLIVLTNEEIQRKIYDEINKKSLIFKNNYEISELETKIENSEFKYEDNLYKAQIVIKINYSIDKKMFLLSKNREESMFLTNMELVGNEWVIKEIQKFGLE
ncbi:TcaA 3rd/4th domain-containing protein [Clostridium gasigenes]|uniref:TcaA 4th domain-containing protein n=1 Tax=Clostridium gasigenes TaxID=94869 RepID=A0A1H0S8X0_9CLOT|nr:hypothetical protein [Clostridium gasigenes]MBU3089479.1 hypothetical protein [Clostridium gasigenes]SDP37658.1 hypothetical protein SAMN04488529_104202 [Clostridium gasigenes]